MSEYVEYKFKNATSDSVRAEVANCLAKFANTKISRDIDKLIHETVNRIENVIQREIEVLAEDA